VTAASHLFNDTYVVFADGACSGNPGSGGWGAIIATPQGQVIELGGGERESTNNRMELMATIRALVWLDPHPGRVAIHTDSTYVIKGITQWIWGWKKRGWKTAEGADVANAELWKKLHLEVTRRGPGNPIDWRYVRGHTGVPGNERVDEIAVAFSKGRRIELYQGPLLKYPVAVHDIPENCDVPERKPEIKGPKAAAYSYLSVVNGAARRHATWPECEARVKGRPGAKFKKAMSAAQEAEILADWGLSPDEVI
jgi:ribonuclease HI